MMDNVIMDNVVDNVVDLALKVMSGDLPQVLHCIFSHLPVRAVGRLSTVCLTWNELANKNKLWEELCARDEVSLPQELQVQVQEQADQGKWCYYKLAYYQYRETLRKWMTGEGVSTFSKTLLLPNGTNDAQWSLVMSMCSRYILTNVQYGITTEHYISVYCAVTGEYSHQLSGLPGSAMDIIVSSDETMAVAHSWMRNVVCLWKIDTGELLQTFQHQGTVFAKTLCGKMLAVGVGGPNPVVFLWSMSNYELVHQLCCTRPDLLVMNGQHIAICNQRGGVLQLWNVETWTHSFTWNVSSLTQVSQLLLDKETKSLIGRTIVHETVCIWDTDTGFLRGTVTAPPGYHYHNMLIDDGTLVLAAVALNSSQGTLSVVELRAAQPVQFMMPLIDVRDPPGGAYGHALCELQSVGSGLVIMSALYSRGVFVNLWNVKQQRFVRGVTMGGGQLHKVRGSFNKLQVLKHSNVNAKRVYDTYDFSAD